MIRMFNAELLKLRRRRVAVAVGLSALAFAAVVLALAEILTVAASTMIAPTQDISTASWFGAAGLGEAAGDYATALLGMALAIFVRSIPVALAIGIVWTAPLEHLIQNAWSAAGDWFPGLLLEGLASAAPTTAPPPGR